MYFLLDFLLPVIMLITSFCMYKFPPKNINRMSGYRTQRAMKNIETWKEANKYSATLFFKFSLVSFIITIGAVVILGHSEDATLIITLAGVVLVTVELTAMIAMTEKHLKEKFEKQ